MAMQDTIKVGESLPSSSRFDRKEVPDLVGIVGVAIVSVHKDIIVGSKTAISFLAKMSNRRWWWWWSLLNGKECRGR
jgi:hypothetical protein